MSGAARVEVRQADIADCELATPVLEAFNLWTARRRENVPVWWDWIWTRNPALMPGRHHPPPGWVLEIDGEIQGFFGNIPARYRLGDDTLVCSIASHWAVYKPFREHTRRLADAWFGQSEPDLLLVSTGIEATGRLFRRYGGAAMPAPDYTTVLYWVLDGTAFTRAALRRRGAGAAWVAAGARVGGPVLSAGAALQRRRPGRLQAGLEPERIALDAVGDEFDALWERKAAETRRLMAYRGAADLRWHFEPRGDKVSVLRCRRGGELAGYLVLMAEEVVEIGLRRLKIVDLVAAGDDAPVLDALLAAAWEQGREMGGHVIELVGFPRTVRARAEAGRPFARRYATHPFYYRGRTPALHGELERPERWYPTLYDGDGCLYSIGAP